ncbi:hypothetical protein KOAAANKH_00126 [Brevundimonas sp. NIBR10]|uniref:hypothetical protein n=1 Tax=Brevundimonas sp. NIBR10 TaxID=3015997 RepID=UPI0022F19CAF|nr:hypothetical protein [Brevundimonas sp. NIBR10]WGM45265.1 hypothetical protein KOAAANKH_00126 [Brevundimonas sp. NIBR10]
MNAAAVSAGPATVGAAAHRTIAEQLSDPAVYVEFAPGACAYQASDIFGGPERAGQGPHPDDVIKSVCRSLRCGPLDLVCDPDPADARCAYIADVHGVRLCRVSGLTPDQANSALLSVSISGWVPGDREIVTAPTRTVADLMPGQRTPLAQERLL